MSESQAIFINHESIDPEIQARARELWTPLSQGEKDLLFPHVRATDDPIVLATSGLEFIEEHMREPGPHPAPSEVALDAIRRVGEQLRVEREGTSAAQDLPPASR